jgi:hypothetical protein
MFICHYLTSNCNCGAWLSNSQLGQSWLMTQIGIAREGSYDFGMFGKRPKLNKYAKRRQTICGLADATSAMTRANVTPSSTSYLLCNPTAIAASNLYGAAFRRWIGISWVVWLWSTLRRLSGSTSSSTSPTSSQLVVGSIWIPRQLWSHELSGKFKVV